MTGTKNLSVPSGAKESATKSTTKKQPYRAYELSGEEERYLEIRCKVPAPSKSPSNARLTGMLTEWRAGQVIQLEYFSVMTVEIEGEQLTELARAIRQWKVEWIAEFDPQMHELPANPDAPFIKSITFTTARPEGPPPLNKRH